VKKGELRNVRKVFPYVIILFS